MGEYEYIANWHQELTVETNEFLSESHAKHSSSWTENRTWRFEKLFKLENLGGKKEEQVQESSLPSSRSKSEK